MAARWRAEMVPGSAAAGIELVVVDMATAQVPGEFAPVHLLCDTITNLPEQGEQLQCFRNAAAHLGPGRCLLVEVGVPVLQRLPPGEEFRPFHVGREHLGFDRDDLVGSASPPTTTGSARTGGWAGSSPTTATRGPRSTT